MTNPHSDELAEKREDIFSSFVLRGAEFHLCVLQISQERGPKSLLRVLHMLNFPQPTLLVEEELCASHVLRQAHGKGQLPPQGPVHKRRQTRRSSGWISAVIFFTLLLLPPIQQSKRLAFITTRIQHPLKY